MCAQAGFHLVLAGFRFNKCNLRKHALRCYQMALPMCAERDWVYIDDHMYSVLGRNSFHLGQLEV